jgi:Tol biopolymer transport system component
VCADGGGGHEPEVLGDSSRGNKVVFVTGPQIYADSLGISVGDPAHPSMEMYAVNADGSDLTQLTSATVSELGIPNTLPDGRAMRFVWSPDGSTVQKISYDDPNLLPGGATGARSPDGKKLATVTTDSSRAPGDTSSAPPDDVDLSVRTSAGTKGVPDHGEDYSDESSPVFSPDSEKLAFINTAEVYVANADGSDQRKLTDDVDGTEAPVFSPDSKKIAFVGQLLGGPHTTDLFVSNVDGTCLTRLTSNPSNKYDPIGLDTAYLFSPDSKKIAFVVSHTVREPGRGYQPVDHIESDLYVENVDGTGLTRLTRSEIQGVGVVTWAGE